MELLETWHSLYGLRYCPITLIQIAFSAGTVYILTAMQACCGVHVAREELRRSLDQQKLVMQHLHEMGRSWSGASEIAEILLNLTQDKLLPILDRRRIYVRNEEFLHTSFFSTKKEEELAFDPLALVSRSFANADQFRRRVQQKENQQPTALYTPTILGGRTTELQPPIRPRQPENPVVPITSWESSSPSDFVHVLATGSETAASTSSLGNSPDISMKSHSANPLDSFDWPDFSHPHKHYFADSQGCLQPVGSFEPARAFEATSPSPAVMYPSTSELGGFSCILDGQTSSFGPYLDQFNLRDSSFVPMAVMNDTAYSAAPLGLSMFGVDERHFLTSSEAASVDINTDHFVDHFTHWVDSVSQKFC